MKPIKVEVKDTPRIRKILRIHDRIPGELDTEHRPSDDFIEKLIVKIQLSSERQGFWILTESDSPDDEGIVGILWAGIRTTDQDHLGCMIKSLWIHPRLRKRNLSVVLSQACIEWAKEIGATRLMCATHFSNGRMREVLKKNHFKPGMIEYSLPLTVGC